MYIKRFSGALQAASLEEMKYIQVFKKKSVRCKFFLRSVLSWASSSAVCRPARRLLFAVGWCYSEKSIWGHQSPGWTDTPGTSSMVWSAETHRHIKITSKTSEDLYDQRFHCKSVKQVRHTSNYTWSLLWMQKWKGDPSYRYTAEVHVLFPRPTLIKREY